MTKHWDEKRTKEEGEQSNNVSQASTQTTPKKPDRNSTATETQRTQKRLIFAAIMNGWSHTSL